MSRLHILLRLVGALLLGFLCALFLEWFSTLPGISQSLWDLSYTYRLLIDQDIPLLLIFIVAPFFLGIISSVIHRGIRDKEPAFSLLALGSGQLFLAGVCLYGLPQAISADAACPKIDTPIFCNDNTLDLIIFWIIATAFVLIGSLMGGLLMGRPQRKKLFSSEPSSPQRAEGGEGGA